MSTYKIRLKKECLVQLRWIFGLFYTRGMCEIGTESETLFYDTVACQGTDYIPEYYTSIPLLFGQPKTGGSISGNRLYMYGYLLE